MKFRISDHAHKELTRRGIRLSDLEAVLHEPQQIVPTFGGREVFQSKVVPTDGQPFLLRAIVDSGSDPPIVVTVYRTSKIHKYWRT